MLGRNKEDKKEVAIKFMDVSENCKHSSRLINTKFYSGISKYDIRNLQRSRVLKETQSQEHYRSLSCFPRRQVTMHDHGVCSRWRTSQIR